MVTLHPTAGAIALALAGAAAAAQTTNPGGMPPGPGPRPIGMGEQDSATMPSASDQIGFATQRAATERAAAGARRGTLRARPATPDEIIAGSALADMAGEPIGTIESVGADGAVVTSGSGSVRVPLDAFGIARGRLLLGISKADFEAAAARANAEP